MTFGSAAVALSPSQMQYAIEQAKKYTMRGGFQARSNKMAHNNDGWLKSLLARIEALENHCAREYRNADLAGGDKEKWNDEMPLDQINRSFAECSLGLKLSWNDKAELLVYKQNVGAPYGFNEMSDGERAGFILAASVILAEEDGYIFIDEPERHLHRSISSPMLRFLYDLRPDLKWVIATHDLSLLRDFPDPQILCLYAYNGSAWRSDVIEAVSEIPQFIQDAILGARERVLFVEGKSNSLDTPLYQILFPDVTILPKGNCRQVVNAVSALNSLEGGLYIHARGMVDGDNDEGLDNDRVQKLGVYAIESLYFHSAVLKAVYGKVECDIPLDEIMADALNCINDEEINRLSQDAANKIMARDWNMIAPRKIEDLAEVMSSFTPEVYEGKQTKFRNDLSEAVENKDWDSVIGKCSVKRTGIPKKIADKLDLTQQGYYKHARIQIRDSAELQDELRNYVPNPFDGSDS